MSSMQNTPEWRQDRLFHFTSSELYKLLSEPREKAKKEAGELSQSAKTYIYDKLAEFITGGMCLDFKEVNTLPVKWGQQLEPEAIREFEKRTGLKVKECGFFKYNKYFGGSPDGICDEDRIIEVKCPYNSSNHVENLLIKNQEEFKKLRPEYYAQIQGNLISTKLNNCIFISYDPRCQNDIFVLKEIEILKDDEFIENALKKLEKAKAYLDELINKIITINIK